MTLERTYHHCPRCAGESSHATKPSAWPAAACPRAVTRMTGATAALVSFARLSIYLPACARETRRTSSFQALRAGEPSSWQLSL